MAADFLFHKLHSKRSVVMMIDYFEVGSGISLIFEVRFLEDLIF